MSLILSLRRKATQRPSSNNELVAKLPRLPSVHFPFRFIAVFLRAVRSSSFAKSRTVRS